MNCDELNMAIESFWSEDLSKAEMRKFIKHINECPSCRKTVGSEDPALMLLPLTEKINKRSVPEIGIRVPHRKVHFIPKIEWKVVAAISVLVLIILPFVLTNRIEAPTTSGFGEPSNLLSGAKKNSAYEQRHNQMKISPANSVSVVSNLETDAESILQFKLDEETEIVMLVGW